MAQCGAFSTGWTSLSTSFNGDLAEFAAAVKPIDPVTTGLPVAGDGYEYRSFRLEGSDGLASKGFLRAIAEMK